MKLLIVDDHHLFLEGMRHVLQRLDPELVLVEAHNARQAIAMAAEHADLDLVLLDINLPDTDGFAALTQLSENHPLLPIVVLSASEDARDIQRALDEGAMGFIPKSSTADVMLSALQLVRSGGVYVPSALLKERQGGMRNGAHRQANGAQTGLTPRQLEVLARLIHGESNKQIGLALGLAEPTVKAHITAILKALGVTNRTQAALAAESLGLFQR